MNAAAFNPFPYLAEAALAERVKHRYLSYVNRVNPSQIPPNPPSLHSSPLDEQFFSVEPAWTDAGHDRSRRKEREKKRRDEERRVAGEDGGADMAAGAISADAAGPSLDSTGFYWVGSVWGHVQDLETREEELLNTSLKPPSGEGTAIQTRHINMAVKCRSPISLIIRHRTKILQ